MIKHKQINDAIKNRKKRIKELHIRIRELQQEIRELEKLDNEGRY